MPMVTALTTDAAEAMCPQVIHLSPTVETSMRMTEGGTKAEAHRYSYSVDIIIQILSDLYSSSCRGTIHLVSQASRIFPGVHAL